MTQLRLRRIYEPPSPDDGFRVLVDRLWPRGLRKASAGVDLWCRDAAPSAALRTWWAHDPVRFDEFATRYRAELHASGAAADLARTCAHHDVVTLLFAARDPLVNHAVVLKEQLEGALG